MSTFTSTAELKRTLSDISVLSLAWILIRVERKPGRGKGLEAESSMMVVKFNLEQTKAVLRRHSIGAFGNPRKSSQAQGHIEGWNRPSTTFPICHTLIMVENVLVPRCNLCRSSENAQSLCSGCKVARYCNSEHQLSDWDAHKSACNKIKKCRVKLEREETKLRNDPGDGFFTPANPFENSVGHFWGILSTRDYMRARIDWVINVLKIDSRDAVTTGLENIRDMLRLCRSDNLGVRDMVPNLLLRLNEDQKCYDFIKWYATEGARSDYDWGDMSLPYLNLENEDVMEDVVLYCGRYFGAAHALPAALIKLRMLLDLRDLRSTSSRFDANDISNFDPTQYVRGHPDLRSPIWSVRPSLLSLEALEDRIKLLEQQTNALFTSVKESNKFIWGAIVRPEQYAHMSPSSYSPGSIQEAIILLLNNGKSWKETDGAVEWIRGKL
ncbi:hypothetical protein NMY22_g19476 [Coprinellus aureogranulatus]|nr:hypothetical protein NMY22_g19476 [Coprinellus aureogranulatus]